MNKPEVKTTQQQLAEILEAPCNCIENINNADKTFEIGRYVYSFTFTKSGSVARQSVKFNSLKK